MTARRVGPRASGVSPRAGAGQPPSGMGEPAGGVQVSVGPMPPGNRGGLERRHRFSTRVATIAPAPPRAATITPATRRRRRVTRGRMRSRRLRRRRRVRANAAAHGAVEGEARAVAGEAQVDVLAAAAEDGVGGAQQRDDVELAARDGGREQVLLGVEARQDLRLVAAQRRAAQLQLRARAVEVEAQADDLLAVELALLVALRLGDLDESRVLVEDLQRELDAEAEVVGVHVRAVRAVARDRREPEPGPALRVLEAYGLLARGVALLLGGEGGPRVERGVDEGLERGRAARILGQRARDAARRGRAEQRAELGGRGHLLRRELVALALELGDGELREPEVEARRGATAHAPLDERGDLATTHERLVD